MITIELTHSTDTEYVSDEPYTSLSTDTPANTPYRDVIKIRPRFTQRIDGNDVGVLVLVNDGTMDDWHDYNWKGYEVKIYVDGTLWLRALNGGIVGAGESDITFHLNDAKSILSVPLQTNTLSDGRPEPILLGAVWNAACIETSTNNYQVHEDVCQLVIFRDDATEANTTPAHVSQSSDNWALGTLASGTFVASTTPTGTASGWVQQEDYYAEDQIQYLCDKHSITTNSASLALLPTDLVLGHQWVEPTSLQKAIDDICGSIGAFSTVNNDGELVVKVLELPTGAPDHTLTEDDIFSIQRRKLEPQASSIRLDYDPNFQTISAPDNTVLTPYKYKMQYRKTSESTNGSAAPDSAELIYKTGIATSKTNSSGTTASSDIATELTRRETIRFSSRAVWSIKTNIDAELGDLVEVTAPVQGWRTATKARVIGIGREAGREINTIEVWL